MLEPERNPRYRLLRSTLPKANEAHTKIARIVVTPPMPSPGWSFYWFALEAVGRSYLRGSTLRSAFALRRVIPDSTATRVDPDERDKAIAKLMAWARKNGWRVEE
jgi:hypothetical protein